MHQPFRRHLLVLLALLAVLLLPVITAYGPGPAGVLGADDGSGAPAAPADARPETTLHDFDEALPDDLPSKGCELSHLSADDAPFAGAGAMRMTLGREFGYVRLAMPDGVNFAIHDALAVSLRLQSDDAVGLRWYAFDANGKGIWQRRDEVAAEQADGQWHRHTFPLAGFRWGDRSVGDWAEVVELVLVIFERDQAITIDVDELALRPGTRGAASAWPTEEWLRDIAFGNRPAQFVRRGRILVGIDVPDGEGVSAEELGRLADRLAPLTAWVKRLFGDAVRPVGGDLPVPMLIFRNEIAYHLFFRRLGNDWNATINPPEAQGYTVQDFATSSYDPAAGLGRPVYLHETMHAVVARDLRIVTGNPAHSWLQEGLANYLQLSLYPRSLPRAVMARHFRQRPRRDAEGFFKPIRHLLTHRVGVKHYAQLATLLAFLEAEHPDWLPVIARQVADGVRIDRVLAAVGTDFESLEAEWFAWGRALYSGDPPAGPGSHFPRPAEWPAADGHDSPDDDSGGDTSPDADSADTTDDGPRD